MLFGDEPTTLHTVWAPRSYPVDISRVLGFSNRPGPVEVDWVDLHIVRCKRLSVDENIGFSNVPMDKPFLM